MPQSADRTDDSSAFKHLFDAKHLQRLGEALKSEHPEFDLEAFKALSKELAPLEMKPRVKRISAHLRDLLPKDYRKALAIITRVPEDLPAFDYWPLTHFVQSYGLDHASTSLSALRGLTRPFTSEWAIRPFLIQDEAATLAFLLKCAADEDHRIRRWASEGSRPRLPWGEQLKSFIADPRPTFAILEKLRYDDELYVRKSVANHINDISKDHPEVAIALLTRWLDETPPEHQKKIEWITRHALRSLIKGSHPKALALLGAKPAKIRLTGFKLTKKSIQLGDTLSFALELHSESRKPQKLIVDYALHLKKANGQLSPKVFKLKTLELPAQGSVEISKSHVIKKITTRVYYGGVQELSVQVNGQILATIPWSLKV